MMQSSYVTNAIHSTVYDENNYIVGHIGIFDIDVGKAQALKVAETIPSRAILIRTSPGKYHVWTLELREFDEWLAFAKRLNGIDQDQLQTSEDRGYFVGRIEPKINSDGKEIAPKPKVVGICHGNEHSTTTESTPHYQALCDLPGIDPTDPKASKGERSSTRIFHQEVKA